MPASSFPDYDCRSGTITSTRRDWIGGTASGFFGFALAHSRGSLFGAGGGERGRKLLVIWAGGGPSQFETFDPKPGTETGGGTGAIPTSARGLRISETLPGMAKEMHRLSVIRNLTSNAGEHDRATYLLHTGYPLVEAFPRPAMGAVMAHRSESGALPGYVAIGNRGFGPAFLGAGNSPFSIESPGEARRLLRTLESRRRRIQLTNALSRQFGESHGAAGGAEERLAVLSRIEELIDTSFSRALDVDRDPAREEYGEGELAGRMILARRLLEVGVPFVEVFHGGWDTHSENAANTRRLCRQLDRPWATLMRDLGESGLLDETIVVWLGEFGRTPRINANRGRDHFPDVIPVVIGGGGIPGGRIIGDTNRDGTAIDGDAHRVADLFATIYRGIGLSPDAEFPTDFGSMTSATDNGKAIAGLL